MFWRDKHPTDVAEALKNTAVMFLTCQPYTLGCCAAGLFLCCATGELGAQMCFGGEHLHLVVCHYFLKTVVVCRLMKIGGMGSLLGAMSI